MSESSGLAQTSKELETINTDMLQDYLQVFGIAQNLSSNEQLRFISIAKAFNLNPFKHEIYITAYGQGEHRKCSIIIGYEVYIKRAEMTGLLNGWKVWVDNSAGELTAHIEISRKDWEKPFQHEVYITEAIQYDKSGKPTLIWQKKPRFMLKKVCIGQGFRLCFSDALGGMPYTQEEAAEAEPRNVTPASVSATTSGMTPEDYELTELWPDLKQEQKDWVIRQSKTGLSKQAILVRVREAVKHNKAATAAPTAEASATPTDTQDAPDAGSAPDELKAAPQDEPVAGNEQHDNAAESADLAGDYNLDDVPF